MKYKVYSLLIIFSLILTGCSGKSKVDNDVTIDDILYLEEESSFSYKTVDDIIFFAVEVWLKNNTKTEIDFSMKIIFEDPILYRELGEEIILGERDNLEPLIFTIEPGKKSLYGGSFKIDKTKLTNDEIVNLTNDVKVILFDSNGFERTIINK